MGRSLKTVAHPGFSKEGGAQPGSGGEAPCRQRIFAVFT